MEGNDAMARAFGSRDARRGAASRIVSAACFRLVALQLETQNEVDVLKPVLEELEVLRLGCALGALPDATARDFEFELLEAKDFDDDFARFLRSDVFNGTSNETTPRVRVVGVFGKQAQVKEYLQRLQLWDRGMADRLQEQELGLFAVLSSDDQEEETATKTLVVFPWLLDESFHSDRLRETPAYLLRLLTCLTNHVTCCFSGDDKQLMEKIAAQDDAMGDSDDEWRAYSAEFHVEQQDAKDDVRSMTEETLALPLAVKAASRVDIAKGTYAALTAIVEARPTKSNKRFKTTFKSPTSMCNWIYERLDRFDLRVSSYGWTASMKEEMLRLCGGWPSDQLGAIEATYLQSSSCVEDHCRDEIMPALDAVRADLQAAGEKVFNLSTLLHDDDDDDMNQLPQAIGTIKANIQKVKKDESFVLAPESTKTLWLPGRVQRVMEYCFELFQNGSDEQLNNVLERAPTMTLEELEIKKGGGEKGILEKVKSWFSSSRDESTVQISDAFRERIREPLETMKQIWWAEVTAIVDAYSEHVLKAAVERKAHELRCVCDTDRVCAIGEAFAGLLRKWAISDLHGLCLHVHIQPSRSDTITCSMQAEEYLPPRNQLHVWNLKTARIDAVARPVAFLGEVDLVSEEEVLAVFTIQTRSILLVSLYQGHTLVRRVEFDSGHRVSRPPHVQNIRDLPRASANCDYYGKERLFVLADALGKIGVYRLDEKLSAMDIVRTFDMSLKTSLEMPLKAIMLSDGILYMVDHTGALQSLNTRNHQTSRKKILSPMTAIGTHHHRLLRAMDGGVLGWLDRADSDTSPCLKFIAADDMRELPQSISADLPKHFANLACEVVDDSLIVADPVSGMVFVIKLEVSLKSESYRIRSTDSATAGSDAILLNGPTSAELQMLSHHWLWTFYHLYEKFPVRGELFRTATGAARRVLELSFVCDAERTSDNTDFDDGCQKLLSLIMEKLQLLNKPLYGLDLAGVQVTIECGAAAQASMMEEYDRIDPHSVATLLRELVTFVPVQICRAEFNSLTLMNDGQYKPHDDSDGNSSLSSADIALKLRFGLLSPLLSSWKSQCIVVTSMGKQSTGKSYFLNHLTGSSFAISGARCTDGAWLSVRFLPNGVMLVVIDFEGLGSFERTEQEDVFLSVLNASVSMLTIFRMEMRLDKEIDDLFSKFQKGSQLIKSDPQLFRGKLYMSVKDVNPNDQRGVVGEFVAKFQRLLEANKEQNFLTDMYAGQLDINCSPPLGTVGYYRSLSHAQKFIDKQLCGNPKAGFASGKAFLDCVRLLLAKVSILDWTSLDESSLRMKIAEATKQLPSVLRYGAACDGNGANSTKASASLAMAREKLADAATGEPILATLDEVCAANPSLASRWRSLIAASIVIDRVDDEAVDLGPSASLVSANQSEVASNAIRALFKTFTRLVGAQLTSKNTQHDFDGFLSFVIRRRCLRVQKWTRSMFGDRIPEAWTTTERQALSTMQTLFVRCLDSCSKCQLGCMKVSIHSAGGDQMHDCSTDHACSRMCTYCANGKDEEVAPVCSKPAGHEGRCECEDGDHTCSWPCLLDRAMNCGKLCSKKADHDESEDHRCSVGLHKCGEPCVARDCSRQCVLDVEFPHTVHKCEVDRCLSQCVMEGCNRSCSSTDHFHGQTEAKIAFSAENPDVAAKECTVYDACSEKPTIHMCDEAHACPRMCAQDGICHIDVLLKQSSKTFVGARSSFQYTFQEMNGARKKCVQMLAPGETTHTGSHSCVAPEHDVDEDEEMKSGDAGDDVRHYCDVRCPCCSYYCQREHGHEGLHKTTHGNMRNTVFLSDDNDIDFVDRKYAAGERGTAEMCNLYCSKMGRGHVHFLDCEKPVRSRKCMYTGSREDMRRHCTFKLEPKPEHEQDEVLHERFWDTLGWEDPCASVQEREEFGKCAYKCDAPDHDGKQASYCVLPAWHSPETKPSSAYDGFSYVSGHKFECSHVAADNKMHHIFVLDASGSMQGPPWEKLNGAFREYIHNRIDDGATLDLVTVITFDSAASIVWEALNITTMTQATAPFHGGGTSFAAALRAANEVLSRVSFEMYKPVIVFFSDGQPHDPHEGEQLASHIAESYAKYGLDAFAVGFGSINLTVLQRVAERLGGSFRHVLNGSELKTTFHSISASLGTRAGLALTRPLHEMICAICQKELAAEVTATLTPCRHELHQRCLRRLVESGTEGDEKRCPTCRHEIQVD